MTVRVAIMTAEFTRHPTPSGAWRAVSASPGGRRARRLLDHLGHGTAVTAANSEESPGRGVVRRAGLRRTLSTRIGNLIKAIAWAARNGIHVANLSLGTSRIQHEPCCASRWTVRRTRTAYRLRPTKTRACGGCGQPAGRCLRPNGLGLSQRPFEWPWRRRCGCSEPRGIRARSPACRRRETERHQLRGRQHGPGSSPRPERGSPAIPREHRFHSQQQVSTRIPGVPACNLAVGIMTT